MNAADAAIRKQQPIYSATETVGVKLRYLSAPWSGAGSKGMRIFRRTLICASARSQNTLVIAPLLLPYLVIALVDHKIGPPLGGNAAVRGIEAVLDGLIRFSLSDLEDVLVVSDNRLVALCTRKIPRDTEDAAGMINCRLECESGVPLLTRVAAANIVRRTTPSDVSDIAGAHSPAKPHRLIVVHNSPQVVSGGEANPLVEELNGKAPAKGLKDPLHGSLAHARQLCDIIEEIASAKYLEC